MKITYIYIQLFPEIQENYLGLNGLFLNYTLRL